MSKNNKPRFSGQPLDHSIYEGFWGSEQGHFYSVPSEICDRIDSINEKYGQLSKIPDEETVDVFWLLSKPNEPYFISKYPVRIQVNHIKCLHGYLIPTNNMSKA